MNYNTNTVNGSSNKHTFTDEESETLSQAAKTMRQQDERRKAELELRQAEAEADRLAAQARLKSAENTAALVPLVVSSVQELLTKVLTTYENVELARLQANVKLAEVAPEAFLKQQEMLLAAQKEAAAAMLTGLTSLAAALPSLAEKPAKPAVKKVATKKRR